jgi:hypothetical protein
MKAAYTYTNAYDRSIVLKRLKLSCNNTNLQEIGQEIRKLVCFVRNYHIFKLLPYQLGYAPTFPRLWLPW